MTITVLSLYSLFFIDDTEKMWGVLKDGRISSLKEVPSFPCFSSDAKGVVGVRFTGDKTAFYARDVKLFNTQPYLLTQVKGYFYYPALWVAPKLKLAAVKADLLNKKGCGDLTVFERKRTRFTPVLQLPARIHPSVWHISSGDLIYISADNQLIRTDFKSSCVLSAHAQAFAFHQQTQTIAVYDNDKIILFSKAGVLIKDFIAFHVTALSFSASAHELYFATYKDGQSNLYRFHLESGLISLVLSHPTRICTLLYERMPVNSAD